MFIVIKINDDYKMSLTLLDENYNIMISEWEYVD